jgi:formyltetrahydrofolate-dependent phosphoribosylglycinamide formyltransferase
MFKRLQKKWKVNGWRLLLILVTFAVGGSLTGYLGKRLMNFTGIETAWIYIPVYIILVTLIWPLMVLLVSIPLGQFTFFINYLKKMGRRIGIQSKQGVEGGIREEKRIAIFASGAGSNAKKIIEHFKTNPSISVALIVCNKPAAGVLKVAESEHIPILLIDKERFLTGDAYVDELKGRKIDFIALAGFLWRIPHALIAAYRQRIINIHPALLPKFGGKGFYGEQVHRAVLDAGESESGITIHYVDEHYDHGDIILQVNCPVQPGDTPSTLAERIHILEHANYPVVVEELVGKLTS